MVKGGEGRSEQGKGVKRKGMVGEEGKGGEKRLRKVIGGEARSEEGKGGQRRGREVREGEWR